jgi:acyl-CoA reductase-like NAD-dependent aldehyde dehydrogenase
VGNTTVIEPATEGVLAEIPRVGIDETDAAIARAKAAFPSWRRVSPDDRAGLMRRLADGLDARREELAVLEARNAGKPISDARAEMGWWSTPFATTREPPSACSATRSPSLAAWR